MFDVAVATTESIMLYFLDDLPDPFDELLFVLCVNAAKTACCAEGDWCRPENACGAEGPTGKNPRLGMVEEEE